MRDIVDMIAESDKQVEEQLAATIVHLKLHCAAALEGRAAANDESKVVSAQLGVGVGRVGIGVASRGENRTALDAGLWTHKYQYMSYAMGSNGA